LNSLIIYDVMMEQSNSHIQVIAQPKEFGNFVKNTNSLQWRKTLCIAVYCKCPITDGKRSGNVLDVATVPREKQLKNSN